MRQKLFFSLGFLFLAILITAGACSGSGPTPKAVMSDPTPNPLDLGTGSIGDTLKGSFSITNQGDANLEYRFNDTQGNPKLGTLLPNQQATETIEVTCEKEGTFDRNVSITSNGGDKTLKLLWKCTSVDPNPYNIQFVFVGSSLQQSPARQQVFKDAAQRWSEIIIRDLQSVDIDFPAGDGKSIDDPCFFATEAIKTTVDDLIIFARIAPIDGVNGTLGRAGPSFIRRPGNDLPYVGCMEFDEADVAALEAQKTFDEVILHEMGHVIGIGSLWDFLGYLDYSSDNDVPNKRGCADIISGLGNFVDLPTFNGSQAKLSFGVLKGTGTTPVPVEDLKQPGTGCSHWDEETFDHELMTGFLGGVTSSIVNPLSSLTIASLEDLGYEVDYTEAEPYSIPSCSPTCGALRSSATETPWEVIITPKGYINQHGQITYFKDLR